MGLGKQGVEVDDKSCSRQCKAEKYGCCENENSYKGIERHIKETLIKAWLGSVRLAHLSASYHWEPLLKAE